jgi:hypothetical protein
MRPEDVPMGDRILPKETCEKCGAPLEVTYEAGDEEDTVFIGCPNGGEDEGHTEYRGQPRDTLKAWGWNL